MINIYIGYIKIYRQQQSDFSYTSEEITKQKLFCFSREREKSRGEKK